MNVEELAGQVVAVVVDHCRRLAGQVAATASDRVANHVFDLVKERMEGDDLGRAALARLKDRPDDVMLSQALRSALRDILRSDEAFAGELKAGLENSQRPGISLHQDVNQPTISVGQMRRSQIAGRSITNVVHRHPRTSLGVATSVVLASVLFLANRDPHSSPAAPGRGSGDTVTDSQALPGGEGDQPLEQDAGPSPDATVLALFDATKDVLDGALVIPDCTTIMASVTERSLPASRAESTASCEGAVSVAEDRFDARLNGERIPLQEAFIVSTDVISQNPDSATVRVRWLEEGDSETAEHDLHLVRDDGMWRIDEPGFFGSFYE